MTSERALTDGQQPAVSPDGKSIAYSNNGDILVMDTSVEVTRRWDPPNWVYDTTGGKIVQITSGGEIDILPRWTPDGQTVGFVRLQTELDDDGVIYTASSSGGNITQLPLQHHFSNNLRLRNETYGGFGVPMWDFSPDAKYLAFISVENDSDYLNVVGYPLGKQLLHKGLFTNSEVDGPSFAWSLNSDEIAFIAGDRDSLGGRSTRAQLFNLVTNVTVKDSLSFDGRYLSRSPLSNSYLFTEDNAGKFVVRIIDFKNRIETIQIPFIAGIKLSPDDNLLLHQVTDQVYGPDGYKYSQIGIFDIRSSEEYLLVKNGDINRSNYYFEWGKTSNTVIYGQLGKIVKSTFRLP